MRIALIVEGKTERVFLKPLRDFLRPRVSAMPDLDSVPFNHELPTGQHLKKRVEILLAQGNAKADAVIALTDVYDGKQRFKDAQDAKAKMRAWVGREDRFFPHAAQYEFEAWLLPYWDRITELAKYHRKPPSIHPEDVNHNKPPSRHLSDLFACGCRGGYIKTRDANRILQGRDLAVAAKACPELRALLNSILSLCEAPPI